MVFSNLWTCHWFVSDLFIILYIILYKRFQYLSKPITNLTTMDSGSEAINPTIQNVPHVQSFNESVCFTIEVNV